MPPCNAPHYKGPGPALCNAYARPPPRHSTLILPFCHFAGHVRSRGPSTFPPPFLTPISSRLESYVYLGYHLVYCLPACFDFNLFRSILIDKRFAGYQYRMSHIILPFFVLQFSRIPLPPLVGKEISRLHLSKLLCLLMGCICPNIDT